jgi:zinc finger protein
VSDSVSLECKAPSRIEFKVKGPVDLSARLIRSSTSRIIIPELGLELMPGPRSEAFITNIEGLLERFLQVAEQLKGKKKRGKAERLSKEIKRAMDGSAQFTVIVEDDMGNSAVIPADQFET